MKKEIKDLWVAALRSGDYAQGANALRTQDVFCCLGVLCDLSGKTYAHSDLFLPYDVLRWAGLFSNSPRVLYQGSSRALVYLNDKLGLTFNQIADLIEEQM